MLVLFATPYVTENPMRFCRALTQLEGVRVAVITQDPEESLPFPVAGHWQVRDSLDPEALVWAARELQVRLGRASRLLATNEQIQVPAAEARERLQIPGMDPETARNFRDKARMKERFRAAGVPCARSCRAEGEAGAWEFVEQVGFPVCVKPVDGAAAQSTYRVSQAEAFGELLRASAPRPDRPLQIEEFVVGDEHSFETVSLAGSPLWHSLTSYHPTPLDVMRNPWVQWRILLPREVDHPRYDEIRRQGRRALEALGMVTGLSHMEWFRRADGSVAISEVGARPPGAQIVTLMNRAHDMDLYQGWAELMVFDRFEPPPERKYAAGVAFLRGLGSGRVNAVHGLDRVLHHLGDLVTDHRAPEPGQPAALGYEGEGFVIVRHPETRVVEEAMEEVIRTVRVELVNQ